MRSLPWWSMVGSAGDGVYRKDAAARAETQPDQIAHGHRSFVAPETECLLDLGRRELDPLAANPDERLFHFRERGQLLLGEGLIADGDVPLNVDESVEREPAARGELRRPRLAAQRQPLPRSSAAPPRRQKDGEARALQCRRFFAEESIGRAGVDRGRVGRALP